MSAEGELKRRVIWYPHEDAKLEDFPESMQEDIAKEVVSGEPFRDEVFKTVVLEWIEDAKKDFQTLLDDSPTAHFELSHLEEMIRKWFGK